MYVSDYTLSLGSSALAITGSIHDNRDTLKTGWMYPGNNDTSSDIIEEWTMAKMDTNSNGYKAFYVDEDGSISYFDVYERYAIRPVFYLPSDVTSSGGTGTLSDPFILE